MNKYLNRGVAAALPLVALVVAMPAQAQTRTDSGTYGDLSWTAQSNLVAATRTQGGIGETPYTASMPEFSGTVGLLMNGFVCSGTLLNDRRTILTAGHCVSAGGGVPDVAGDGVTVFFRNPGSGPDVQLYYGGPGYSTQQSSEIFVHESYTGEVIDHNDIALVRMAELAPDFAESYGLYTGELTGEVGTITGYGSTSSVGGAVGVNTVGANRLGWFRQGLNEYDYRLGDATFGTDWAAVLGDPYDRIAYSYISDFDNGVATNDATCILSTYLAGSSGTQFCDLGTGVREVGVAGGDSGGGGFIDGRVASVNSYGLSFGTGFGDFRSGLQSSYGEFTGYVPVWYHEDWITGRMVVAGIPEPSTWAMLIIGFGVIGGSLRRRGKAQLRFA